METTQLTNRPDGVRIAKRTIMDAAKAAESAARQKKIMAAAREYLGQTVAQQVHSQVIAESHGLTVNQIKNGIHVLRHATQEEIAGVDRFEIAMFTLSRQITDGLSPEERKRMRETPLGERGKHLERKERQRTEGGIWQAFKQAIEALSTMPRPSDVADIIAANGRRNETFDPKKLETAAIWLMEFDDVWKKRGG